MGERRPANGVGLLTVAYEKAEADATPDARLAILDALAAYPAGPAADITPALTRALNDREWPVRVKAATILRARGVATAAPVRPAPLRQPSEFYESDKLLRPAYSPQAYIETVAGTIQIQLDVIDAPLTTLAFIEQARAGVFNGLKVHRLIPNFVIQAGDPRGDGEGGPGYTIRDELSMRPFVRGSVGMALSGPETGGSQFFITLSPQPHLDARYTLFGHVVKGMELLDRVALGDVIVKITIDDGGSGPRS
jgi:cyclophilin family peptidyl-prolyl cis-trans isomerase